jgi:hypothetical protein
MPIADITEIRFTYADGVKAREEYAPPCKAEATITASVPEGHDGTVALAYIANIARAKVIELLTGVTPVTSPLATSPEQAAADEAAVAPPKTRGRRTKEQIAQDEAAARLKEALVEEAEATAQEPGADDWGVGTALPPVTDEAILKACSEAASAGKKRDDILALIATYKTTAAGVQFSAKDIAPEHRHDFLAKLKAL